MALISQHPSRHYRRAAAHHVKLARKCGFVHIKRDMRTGGQIVIEALARAGVDHIFMVPGESFISVLDALYDDQRIRPIVCRHEAAAAVMAEATGKLTGTPGVAFVTRGPGLANALSGVYAAHQSASPMLLLAGLPPSRMRHREAFQAFDFAGVFGPISKAQVLVTQTADIAPAIDDAIALAISGRPGPVVIGLPEDCLTQSYANPERQAPVATADAVVPAVALEDFRTALAAAKHPLLLLSAAKWSASSAAAIAAFAERFAVPVVTAFRRQDRIDNRSRAYIGHAGIGMTSVVAGAITNADVLVCFGPNLDDITTDGFTLIGLHKDKQKLIALGDETDTRHFPYRADLAIQAPAAAICAALATLVPPRIAKDRSKSLRALRAAYEDWTEPRPTPGDVKLEAVIAHLDEVLPDDAIIASGAGNYAAFLHRYFHYREAGTQLAPQSGSMGYGLPAAIAAKLAFPKRTVVALAGDGCLQMALQELATAAQFELPVITIVADNGQLGTIRMHQERAAPSRVVATTLVNPDFAALAESYGAHAERVNRTEEFPRALHRARASDRPALIHLLLDPDALSPIDTPQSIRHSRTMVYNR